MQPGQRIIVGGSTGSGKTTLAATLAALFDLKHVELDALHWEPNWTPASPDHFRQRVSEAVAADRWVIDGNYSSVRDLIWSRADTVIWLDYPLRLILWRLFWRTTSRLLKRELLWGTNRERFLTTFFTRDSLFWWAVTTYRRRRRQYLDLFARLEYAHLTRIHLRSPRETQQWLALVACAR